MSTTVNRPIPPIEEMPPPSGIELLVKLVDGALQGLSRGESFPIARLMDTLLDMRAAADEALEDINRLTMALLKVLAESAEHVKRSRPFISVTRTGTSTARMETQFHDLLLTRVGLDRWMIDMYEVGADRGTRLAGTFSKDDVRYVASDLGRNGHYAQPSA